MLHECSFSVTLSNETIPFILKQILEFGIPSPTKALILLYWNGSSLLIHFFNISLFLMNGWKYICRILYIVKNQTIIILSKRASFIFDVFCCTLANHRVREQANLWNHGSPFYRNRWYILKMPWLDCTASENWFHIARENRNKIIYMLFFLSLQ